MAASQSRPCQRRPFPLALPPLLCLLMPLTLTLPPSTAAFDLSSLLGSLFATKEPPKCPSPCNCTTRRAEEVLQDYLSKYLPYMGVHMQDNLEKEARATVTVLTAWQGTMSDFSCHLPDNERVRLSDLLDMSSLSFRALKIRCGPGSSVVWDLSAFDAFLSILDISGCSVEKGNGTESMVVPVNLWVLDLDHVPEEAVQSLDISRALGLLALSISNTSLVSLPTRWSGVPVYRIMVIRLADNKLRNFSCEIQASMVSSLNLDNNSLTEVPPCFLDGSKYAHHVSLRHNSIGTLNGPLIDKPEDESSRKPYVMYLDLAHNQLESLPYLRENAALFSLDVSHNRLHSLAPDAFAANKLLQWLDLSHNSLHHVHKGPLVALPVLHYLNLSHNHISSFDFDDAPLTSETATLDLRHNQLRYPPFADTGFVAPRLSRISASNNPFRCDCQLHSFLEFLNVLNSSSQQRWYSLGYWDWNGHDPSVNQPYEDIKDFTCSQPKEMKDTRLHTLSFEEECPLMDGCPALCKCKLRRGEPQQVAVDCSHTRLTTLPAEMPVVPSGASLVLYINQSALKRLDHRPYLRQVSELHAAHSKVSSVSPGAMEALREVRVLSLDNNLLRSLPALTQNLTLSAATNVSLGDNPWTCGCLDLWMPQWLDKHRDVLYNFHSVRCRWTGEMVQDLDAFDLNCGIFSYLPLVIALSVLLAAALIVASLLVKYRLEVLVFLYTRFRLRPFDMYKYDNNKAPRDFQFDVFVSFSQHDYHWVVEKLVDQLENRARPYRLCIHLRDFPVGAPIADNVNWAVSNSRCTLLVLTKDFLASEWCRHEFRTAHARLLKDPEAKLLIAVHGPVDTRLLDRELLAYLRTNTYLKTEDKWFWAKLEYALPAMQDPLVRAGHARNGHNEQVAPPIEMDAIVPVALGGGDVFPKV